MIDLHYWTTPNGHKITIFLEEAQLPYELHVVDINKGEQHEPEFLAISPNNRIPAIVDHAPPNGGAPLAIFESGAILLYLAEKTGLFLPAGLEARVETLKWLFWQMGGLGPMLGQNHHFAHYAAQKIPYAIERYVAETARLYRVLDKCLVDRTFVAGSDYSIADMAIYPWIVPHRHQSQDLADYPHIKRWFGLVASRPAVAKAYALARSINDGPSVRDDGRTALFLHENSNHPARPRDTPDA
jgi:GSH-dependent disulfide-bond oxidoreductase